MASIDRTSTRKEVLLHVENISLSLGIGSERRLILRDVDAEIRNVVRPGMQQGQVVGFLGPSGIGKTQLFRIVAGFQQPDEGQVLVGTEQIVTSAGRIGVVSQNYLVLNHRTVFGNLAFAAMQGGLSKCEAADKANHYLEQFDMIGHRNRWPAELSGGQRQRLAILQQVLVGHQTICMDEPFSGLDVNQVHKVAQLISNLTSHDELLTIIVVTHDIGAALEVSDTLWLMGHEPNLEKPGEFLPGARIIAQSDLIAEGLAWDPDLRTNPKFRELEGIVTERFRTLTHVTK